MAMLLRQMLPRTFTISSLFLKYLIFSTPRL